MLEWMTKLRCESSGFRHEVMSIAFELKLVLSTLFCHWLFTVVQTAWERDKELFIAVQRGLVENCKQDLGTRYALWVLQRSGMEETQRSGMGELDEGLWT